MLNYLCNDYKCDIIFIQKHWLPPFDLARIQQFSPNYSSFGISAMDNVVNSDVFIGRPFGGVGILLSNKYLDFIKFIFLRGKICTITTKFDCVC